MQSSEAEQEKQNEETKIKEAMLELIQTDDGILKLQDIDKKDEPLVSIEFSDQAKEMLGDDIRMIGQHMIHSAIQLFMHRQMNHYHAFVHDEEPEHYS